MKPKQIQAVWFNGTLAVLLLMLVGCPAKKTSNPESTKDVDAASVDSKTNPSSDSTSDTSTDSTAEANTFSPLTYEASSEQLLAARLPDEEAKQGWIRLFDGHTLFGWEIAGGANWSVKDGAIVADQGKPCLLCTSTTWSHFECELEFRAEETTNSGVFLRTSISPNDVKVDCYEVNIADSSNPYPTGQIVQRAKADQALEKPLTGDWQTMNMLADGNIFVVTVDQQEVVRYEDPNPKAAGRIGLQFRSGKIEFRNIRLRPLGVENVIDSELSKWTPYPDMSGKFSVGDQGQLIVDGGKTQLETKSSYDDFVLRARYRLPDESINTGLFFRCIPGDEMMGYECQVNDGMKDNNRLSPADCGTGGIFRRQDARFVAGDTGRWNTIILNAHQSHFAAWVNGVQVSDWTDDRKVNENPRRGLRLEAGTIMVQGHDPETKAEYAEIAIGEVK